MTNDKNKPQWREHRSGWFLSTEVDPHTNMRRTYGMVVRTPGKAECSWVVYLPGGGISSGLSESFESAKDTVERKAGVEC